MEKPTVLKPSMPGSHPVIRAVWLAAFALLLAAVGLRGLGSFESPLLALLAAGWFAAGLVAYLVRHARFVATLARGERALRSGDLPAARAVVAPLLDRYPAFPPVQRLAGLVLYPSGDPLSAASLLETAARSHRDRQVVVTLVAAYAALNKAGDARRSAALRPGDPDVALALAWAELVALGGDHVRGAELTATLRPDTPSRAAMALTLQAIVAAHRGDAGAVRIRLHEAEDRFALLAPDERSFLGYLGGVALRELGSIDDARETFTLAMAAAPETIGEALARRERSHLASASSSAPSSSQPSAD